MTSQCPETLIYEGWEHDIHDEPLELWFQLTGRRLPPHPRGVSCSALWRGYIGTWEIVDGRLYLIGIDGSFVGRDDLSVASLFPEHSERVFADWYTGSLRLPEGRVIDAFPMGNYVYERALILELECGVMTRWSVKHNKAPGFFRVPPKTPPRRRR
jgi:hypothetical protein